jgi:orotidine-5'-phosphate decarboxylase
MSKQVIVALDYSLQEAEAFLQSFPPAFIKVGYQLFYEAGPAWVAKKKEEGYRVFLDLKLHDIPNTVYQGVKTVSKLGVDLLTIHANGGSQMIQRSREAVEQTAVANHRTKILAVTQLTSTDQAMLTDELQIGANVSDSAIHLAQLAQRSGADGVICSGQEVSVIKQATSSEFLAVTPGIRPKEAGVDDQKRVVTPAEAISRGADYLVIGRPITKASDPVQAYENILQSIEEATA